MPPLWRVKPSHPPERQTRTGRQKIKGGPLIDLAALQAAIRAATVTEDEVWVVNHSCENDLEQLEWSYRDLLDCIGALAQTDYRNSEWCETNFAGLRACDAYAIRYDEGQRCRNRQALEFYLKFSVDEDGTLSLLMVRAHLSR